MTTTSTESERAAFEKWLLDEHLLESKWNVDRNCFDDFEAHLAFKAWQAARASGSAAPAPTPKLPNHAYAMSESHGRGFRVIVGYETLADMQTAHEFICKNQVGAALTRPAADGAAQTPVGSSDRAAGETPAAAVDELRGLDTPERVRFYEHDFYPLSNFSAFTLTWRGMRFDTSEAAYHYEKFIHGDIECGAIARDIRLAPSAHEAFKIAEMNKSLRRADWDDIKVDTMRRILRSKVDQHEYVRRKLLATGTRELVEDSWRDDFWGWGPNRDGKNMLGKLWMEVRAELSAAA